MELTWDKPEKTNGNLKHYVVRYTYRLSGSSVTYVKNLRYSDYSANTVKYNLDGLEEFTKYYITVSAKTSVEGLKSAVVTATTLEDGTFSKTKKLFPCEKECLTFPRNLFFAA